MLLELHNIVGGLTRVFGGRDEMEGFESNEFGKTENCN